MSSPPPKKTEPLFLVQQPSSNNKQPDPSNAPKAPQPLPAPQPKPPEFQEKPFNPQLPLKQVLLAICIPFFIGGIVAGILLFIYLMIKGTGS